MKDCLGKLAKEGISEKETVAILSVLEELLESLDNAVDFDTMKGYPGDSEHAVLFPFDGGEGGVPVSAYDGCSESRRRCRRSSSRPNVVQSLLSVLSTTDMKLKAKVLGCLFSMISNYEPGEKVFLFNNGLNAMKTILFSETETNTVYRKVLVLLLQMARAETPYMVSVVYLCSLVEKVPFLRAGEPVV